MLDVRLAPVALGEARGVVAAEVPLLEELVDRVEEYRLVAGLGRLEELAGAHLVGPADAPDVAQGRQDLALGQEDLDDLLVGVAEALEHVEGELVGRRVEALEGEKQAGQGLGVRDHVVLEELVELVVGLLVHEGRDHELVQVVLHRDAVLRQRSGR